MADARIRVVGVTLATLMLSSWSNEHKNALKTSSSYESNNFHEDKKCIDGFGWDSWNVPLLW